MTSASSNEGESEMMMNGEGSAASGITTTEELQVNQMSENYDDEDDCTCLLSPGALIAVVVSSSLLGICLLVWAVSYCTKKKALAATPIPPIATKVVERDLEEATTHSDSPSTDDL